MKQKLTEAMLHTAMSRAIPSFPAITERDNEGRLLCRYRPAEMRGHACEAMATLLVDLGIADATLLATYLKANEYDPHLSDAGLMDLASAVVRVVQAPDADEHFKSKPVELQEAAIRLQLAAENYVDVAGGMTFSPSGRRIT